MKDYKDDTFLARWLDQRLSPEEQASFEGTEDHAKLSRILAAWDQMERPAFAQDRLLQEVKERIATQRTQQAKRKVLRRRWMYAAAASFFLAMAFVWWRFQNQPSPPALVLSAPVGQHLEQELADGTVMHLNAESEATAWVVSDKEPRTVILKGEAYFDVTKGAEFRVETEVGNVRVLGTAFTVMARQATLRVQCYEGMVEVSTSSRRDTLRPGEGLDLNEQASAPPRAYALEEALPGWLNGVTSFWEVPLAEVVAEMERQYGIRITVLDIELDQRVTASFPHHDLSLALETAFSPFGIHAEIRSAHEVVLRSH